MKTQYGSWTATDGITIDKSSLAGDNPQLVMFFGDRHLIENKNVYGAFRSAFPSAEIVGCTTGGEILGNTLYEDSCVYVCIELEQSTFKVASSTMIDLETSFTAGETLGQDLNQEGLKAIFLLADGLSTNGSQLTKGVNSIVHKDVIVSGGLAADAGRFESTLVGYNEDPKARNVVAIGFYGEDLRIRTGSKDGWSIFGPVRTITKAEGPVLYELDGKPALELYKKYLGDEAKNLPESGLAFPCAIWSPEEDFDSYVIRTILSTNEDDQSMTFAGDIPQGYQMRLMWGKFDDLIDAASHSAQKSAPFSQDNHDALSIMISCIGRKILMGQKVGSEIDQAMQHLGQNTTNVGFYSYGEIAKHQIYDRSVLHNQTMTITTISEAI